MHVENPKTVKATREMRSADLSSGFDGQRACNTTGIAPPSTGVVGGGGVGLAAAPGAVRMLAWPPTGAREWRYGRR